MLFAVAVAMGLLSTAVLAADIRTPSASRDDTVLATALHTACFGLMTGITAAAVMYFWPKWVNSEARRIQRLREKKKTGAIHKSDCPCCQ